MSKITIKNGEISSSSGVTIKSPLVINNTLIRKTRLVTASCDVLITDNVLLVSASTADITVTLPNAISCSIGAEYVIKQIDNSEYEVYVSCQGENKIEHETSYSLFNQNDCAVVICADSNNWFIL